jgi:hypothetical protein
VPEHKHPLVAATNAEIKGGNWIIDAADTQDNVAGQLLDQTNTTAFQRSVITDNAESDGTAYSFAKAVDKADWNVWTFRPGTSACVERSLWEHPPRRAFSSS